MYRSGSVLVAHLFPVPRTRRATRSPLATDSTSDMDTPACVTHPEPASMKTTRTRLKRHTISRLCYFLCFLFEDLVGPPQYRRRNRCFTAKSVICWRCASDRAPDALTGLS